jgi:hypothetical protein
MFPEDVLAVVLALRDIYKGRKNCVLMNYPVIEILKYDLNKEKSVKLFYSSNTNTFEIQPPDFKHYSKISFYDYKKFERRWTRNKNFLFPLIKDLQRSGFWDFISNKDFLIINAYNDRIAVDKRAEILNKIIDNKSTGNRYPIQ